MWAPDSITELERSLTLAAAQPNFTEPLAPGQRLGPFLLLAPLGSGGSARVWAVVRIGQLGFSKRMALKVMRTDKLASERARQRFDREALWGAELRHPNLRAVHELGSHDGRPFMAMAWVDASLSELLEHVPGGRLEPGIVCWLGMQACDALATAHAHVDAANRPAAIVHGDVSPGNILLTKTGHVQLADLAASAEPSPGGDVSGQRAARPFFGNLSYASPEAVRGSALDGRADLFSLGCVLYEALTGCPAFEGESEAAVMFQVLEQSPLDIRQRSPDVPEAVVEVVRRALQRRAEERFASAREMRAALASCVAERSSFELERAATSLIESVLGERIRGREEEMQRVFQRFAAAQLAKTETLPLSSVEGRTQRSARAASLPSEVRDSGAPVLVGPARSRPRRRALRRALGLALALLLAALWLGREALVGLARAPQRTAQAELETAARELQGSAVPLQAVPLQAVPPPTVPLQTVPPPAVPLQPVAPQPTPALPASPSAPATAAEPSAAPGRTAPPERAKRPASAVRKPGAAPADSRQTPPSPASEPGFDFKFPENPYGRLKSAP
jgi:serine/threonine protein kinase